MCYRHGGAELGWTCVRLCCGWKSGHSMQPSDCRGGGPGAGVGLGRGTGGVWRGDGKRCHC